ncbi:MAG: hypothetical protein ACT4P0_12890 [Panacagrimonas sp.]
MKRAVATALTDPKPMPGTGTGAVAGAARQRVIFEQPGAHVRPTP